MIVASDGPRFQIGDLSLIVEGDADSSILITSFGTEQLDGAAVARLDVAIVLDGGLAIIKQNDGNGVFIVVANFLERDGAQPIRRRVGVGVRCAPQKRGDERCNK